MKYRVTVHLTPGADDLGALVEDFDDLNQAVSWAQSATTTAHARTQPDGRMLFFPAHRVDYVEFREP